MTGFNKENLFFFNNDYLKISPNSLEHAYLAILNDDLISADKIFSNLDSPRAKWGKILISILEGYMKVFPSYFEVRNFFEIDLDFLLKNNKIDYVQQCLGSLEVLSTVNQEIYKFTARVMLENRLYKAALDYMEKSKKIYYNDPELHFMLAKYFNDIHNYNEAYFYINECLKLLPDYYPAQQMKLQIEEIAF